MSEIFKRIKIQRHLQIVKTKVSWFFDVDSNPSYGKIKMIKIIMSAFIGLLIFPLISCAPVAPKVPLAYEYPKSTDLNGKMVAVFMDVVDNRTNLVLDQHITPSVVSQFTLVALRETQGSGFFKEVRKLVQRTDPVAHEGVDLLIQLSLNNVSVEVPDHDEKNGSMIGGAIALGGLGWAMAGKNETIVIGHAQIGVKISDLRSDRVYHKQIDGQATKKAPIMWMDTSATKSTLAGMALKKVLNDYISFLGTIM